MANFLLVDFNPFIPKISPTIAHAPTISVTRKKIRPDTKLRPYRLVIDGWSIMLITPNIKE